MNKQGQMDVGLGAIMITFIAILVGVILFQSIAQEVGASTNTVTLANVTGYSLPAVTESIYVTEYRAIDSVVIYNATGTLVPAANYTVTNNVINPTTGALSVQITTGAVSEHASDAINISGTAQPLTYISSAGGRSMALLIPIMFALAVAVIALSPTLRSGLLEKLGR